MYVLEALTQSTIFIYMAIIIPKLYHSKELFGWESGHLGQHIPRRIEVSNKVSFVLLIFLCQLFPSSENRFAALMPPNSAKLKDLDQVSVLITVALCYVWQNWAMWMRISRVQMNMWSIERSIDQENSLTQLLMNLYLPDSLKIRPKTLKSSK